MGLIMKAKIKLVKICVMIDADAQPIAPKPGINIRFSKRFNMAPDILMTNTYFCFPSDKSHIFLTELIQVNTVSQVIICKTFDDNKYCFPYKI